MCRDAFVVSCDQSVTDTFVGAQIAGGQIDQDRIAFLDDSTFQMVGCFGLGIVFLHECFFSVLEQLQDIVIHAVEVSVESGAIDEVFF